MLLQWIYGITWGSADDTISPTRYNLVECQAKGHELVELKCEMRKKSIKELENKTWKR